MNDDAAIRQAEKLIGGWVAGTLTAEERTRLLDASMKNQALFDALADEEGLRELLADPGVRRELAGLLQAEPRESWWQRLFRPVPMAAFSAVAVAVVGLLVVRPGFEKMQTAAPAVIQADQEAPSMSPALPPLETPRTPAKSNKAPAPVSARRQLPKPVAQPEPAPAPVASVEAEKRDTAVADVRREAAAPPPAAPAAAGPTPPLPPAAVAETLSDAKAKATAPAPPPIRYRVERLQPGSGMWVEFGGELSAGNQVRVAIEATRDGLVTVRSGGDTVSEPVRAGQVLYYPASGSLPSGAGERALALSFQPGSAVSGFAAPLQAYRARKVQQQAQQAQQTPGGGAAAAPPEYVVTVRLRYR